MNVLSSDVVSANVCLADELTLRIGGKATSKLD